MRFCLAIFCMIGLAACASVPTAPETVSNVDTKLKPGECGMFGWSADERRDFVFFADEKTARYNSVSGPENLTAQSAFPSLEYLDTTGGSVTLRLGQGEVMAGGMRYSMARIVTLTDEGWDRLQPVAIVRSCHPK